MLDSVSEENLHLGIQSALCGLRRGFVGFFLKSLIESFTETLALGV